MSKVISLKKPITPTRQPAAENQDPEKWFRTIVMEADDLNAELRDLKTVLDVAVGASSEEGESSMAVGALMMVQHKLRSVERSAQNILTSTKARRA